MFYHTFSAKTLYFVYCAVDKRYILCYHNV
nr:MAG TPA: hypothetical protein [Caudoviricetes sp.]